MSFPYLTSANEDASLYSTFMDRKKAFGSDITPWWRSIQPYVEKLITNVNPAVALSIFSSPLGVYVLRNGVVSRSAVDGLMTTYPELGRLYNTPDMSTGMAIPFDVFKDNIPEYIHPGPSLSPAANKAYQTCLLRGLCYHSTSDVASIFHLLHPIMQYRYLDVLVTGASKRVTSRFVHECIRNNRISLYAMIMISRVVTFINNIIHEHYMGPHGYYRLSKTNRDYMDSIILYQNDVSFASYATESA